MKTKVYILTPGILPLPSVRGGGVENLIQALAEQNEIEHRIDFVIWGVYDQHAERQSKKYRHASYRYIHMPKCIKLLDQMIWWILHQILHINNILFHDLTKRLYVILRSRKIIKHICQTRGQVIVIEHSALLLFSLLGVDTTGNKVFFHAHNVIMHDYKILHKAVSKLAGVISVSNFLKEKNSRFLGKCRKQYILYNCIDLRRFCGERKMEESDNPYVKKYNSDDKTVLLFSGRITPEKGVLEVVQAFKKVNRKNLRLIIAGGVFYNENIHSKFKKQLIKESYGLDIQFIGYVKYEDMPYLYQMADISVLPSKCEEAAGLVIIESMACGTPVITTKRGGITEYAKDVASYVRIDEHMVEDIAEALINVLNQSHKEKTESIIKMHNTVKRYDYNMYYERFCEIISE